MFRRHVNDLSRGSKGGMKLVRLVVAQEDVVLEGERL